MEQSQNQQQDTQIKTIESVQAVPQALYQESHVLTPELHVTDRRLPKRQECHEFPKLPASNLRKHLSATKNLIINITTLQPTLTKPVKN